jgi:transaldolase
VTTHPWPDAPSESAGLHESGVLGVPVVHVGAAEAPLNIMTTSTPTKFFNDSCAVSELEYAIARGATGATSNPVICLSVLKSEPDTWMPRVAEIVAEHPTWHERRVAWQLYTEMGQVGARVIEPVFDAQGKTYGRLSVQTDPTLHNDAEAMLAQTIELSKLGPNLQVKMPATSQGISMIEEATFQGVNLNVTVSFCVPQVLAIADAIERGLVRREAAGFDTTHMAPVATMMIGRLDDWLKVCAKRDGVDIDPNVIDWAGIACAKRAYGIMNDRGYRTKLLAAAYRHLGHWTELVGGDLVLTIPYEWQVKANQSGHDPEPRIDSPVDPLIIAELVAKLPDFVRAYEPDGLSIEAFDSFGPVLRTLRSFIAAWYDFVGVVRNVMVPDPDAA